MSPQDGMDLSLEVLGRYREADVSQRFMMWFSYPGLRDNFEAIDRVEREERGTRDRTCCRRRRRTGALSFWPVGRRRRWFGCFAPSRLQG